MTEKKGPLPRDVGGMGGFFDPGYGYDVGYGKGAPMPAKSATGEYSIWVGNLPEDVSAQELREVFEHRGVTNMSDVYIPKKFNGFGFVRFTSPHQVDDAPELCHGGLQLGGVDLELKASQTEKRGTVPQPAMPVMSGIGYPTGWAPGYGPGMYMDDFVAHGPTSKKLSTNEHSVWVGNLPKSVTSEELREAF